MWIFTEVADWFDNTRENNDKWIDSGLQPWVGSTLYEDSPWYRNVGIYVAAGTLYSLNKFTGAVASGFVDVLRIGDGVQEGGWGYGKDALRLLMFVGPALRGARMATTALIPALREAGWLTTMVTAVDATPRCGNCSWVAATRMLRWSGVKPLAELSDLVKAQGLGGVADTGGAFADELLPGLRNLGARAELVTQQIQSMDDLASVAAKNPTAATMFSVEWNMGGKSVGHSLFAVRNIFGGLTIIDRSGKAVQSLAELNNLYPGIGSATFYGSAITVDTSLIVRSIGTLPTLANIVSQSVSGYRPDSDLSGTGSQSAATATANAAPGGANGTGTKASPRPAQIASGVLTTTTSQFCFQQNSDTAPACVPVTTKTYKVAAGESLQLISQRVYGNGSYWQQIALANGIKPPKYIIHPGQVLLLP
jgi:nucleoid-associated protein YgaU